LIGFEGLTRHGFEADPFLFPAELRDEMFAATMLACDYCAWPRTS
jgi:hypothetical protein